MFHCFNFSTLGSEWYLINWRHNLNLIPPPPPNKKQGHFTSKYKLIKTQSSFTQVIFSFLFNFSHLELCHNKPPFCQTSSSNVSSVTQFFISLSRIYDNAISTLTKLKFRGIMFCGKFYFSLLALCIFLLFHQTTPRRLKQVSFIFHDQLHSLGKVIIYVLRIQILLTA